MSVNLSQLADDEILDLVRKGNTRAYGELYLRHLDGIYRYLLYRVARNRPEAEDLAQEVFLRAWKTITKNKRTRKTGNFRALLYRIAHNLAVDCWRTEKKEKVFQEEWPADRATGADMPEYNILIKEQTQALSAAIRELEPKLQDVFICRLINGLSHADTARALGLKEGHVRVLQHRALKKIKIAIK